MSKNRKAHLRKRLLITATLIFILIAIIYSIWWLIYAANYESTDDAYVHGNLVTVNSKIQGTVTKINFDDTQMIKAGDLLIELDDTDTSISLMKAKSDLALAIRKTKTLYIQNDSLAADIDVQQANVKRAETLLEKAENDLQRRNNLRKSGGVSGEELLHAKVAVRSAQAELAQAKAALAASSAKLATNQALTNNTEITDHPDIRAAIQVLRKAWLDEQRTKIRAPVSGMVAQRSVQLGQHIQSGKTLMTIVPLDSLWVEANFKENQLKDMHPGQKVSLSSDIYGDKIVYHGELEGISAGSGSAFALLPAQNASGNWIKVIQRVPVRISLDKDELREHPLRVGLSMVAEVDLKSAPDENAPLAVQNTSQSTDIFSYDAAEIDKTIERIIQENLAS